MGKIKTEGNVIQTSDRNGREISFTYDNLNRNTNEIWLDEAGNPLRNINFQFDAASQLVNANDPDSAYSYDYDLDGRVISVDNAGESVEERYVLDGDHIALTFDGGGNQTERFLHGLEIDQVLAQENADGEVLWALTDHQNSVRVILDHDGNIVNQISYDSFGQIINETHSEINFRFSYTGREFDAETGNYYYRARYYDPAVGRFISEDPISFAAGDSNIYRYVGNNPLFYLDPSGFCGVGSSGDERVKVAQSDITGRGECNGACQIAAAAVAAVAASLYWAKENIFGGDKNNDQSGEFEFEQKHPVEEAIEKAVRERERILEDFIEQNQPLETTVKDNTIDPNNINIDIYEPASDPFNVERFGDRDYNNDFDPNLDGYELDDTIRIEPTQDFTNDYSDLFQDRFESSDGLTPPQRKRIEKIDNTIKNHAKPHDFEGVRKELDGIDTGFDHITEMTEASRGLEKHIQGLEGSLRNPNLEPNVRKKLENARDRGIDTLNKMRDTLRGE